MRRKRNLKMLLIKKSLYIVVSKKKMGESNKTLIPSTLSDNYIVSIGLQVRSNFQ